MSQMKGYYSQNIKNSLKIKKGKQNINKKRDVKIASRHMEKFSTLTHKKRTENYKIVRCRFYLSLVEKFQS